MDDGDIQQYAAAFRSTKMISSVRLIAVCGTRIILAFTHEILDSSRVDYLTFCSVHLSLSLLVRR
jgi:hypothetical protein